MARSESLPFDEKRPTTAPIAPSMSDFTTDQLIATWVPVFSPEKAEPITPVGAIDFEEEPPAYLERSVLTPLMGAVEKLLRLLKRGDQVADPIQFLAIVIFIHVAIVPIARTY